MEEKKLTYEQLEHYYNSTVGLWAIDRSPQEVDLNWIVQNAFQLGEIEGEENKLNLKPFDLQKAREGKPVCTRDGRKARIICFDLKNEDNTIVAAVGNDRFENLFCYTKNGELTNGVESDKDLMMLPERRRGWVNVYKLKESTFGYITAYFDTEEKAKEDKEQLTGYVATVKINWEE